MPKVTVRYWAAAKDAAGVPEEVIEAETLGGVLENAAAKRSGGGRPFSAVLARSSLLIDGKQAGHRGADAVHLWDGAVIEVLPPFAGG